MPTNSNRSPSKHADKCKEKQMSTTKLNMADAKKNVGAMLPTASTHKQLQCSGPSPRGAKRPKEEAILLGKWQTLSLCTWSQAQLVCEGDVLVTSDIEPKPLVVESGMAGLLLQRMAATMLLTEVSLFGVYRKATQLDDSIAGQTQAAHAKWACRDA
ncbi:MAG: hypothetical protein FRX49_10251 [Trebouxia sp. A1-2]|nr:MAG: hypothetical protein FRX49_10251 [Trebouxia sp. A1-2]